MAEGDIVWRRPEPGVSPSDRYDGPPARVPPPPDFELVVEEPTAAARSLPALDHDAIDEAERRASRVTYVLGLAAVAVMVVLVCTRLA